MRRHLLRYLFTKSCPNFEATGVEPPVVRLVQMRGKRETKQVYPRLLRTMFVCLSILLCNGLTHSVYNMALDGENQQNSRTILPFVSFQMDIVTF